jgi:hypothetical protein
MKQVLVVSERQVGLAHAADSKDGLREQLLVPRARSMEFNRGENPSRHWPVAVSCQGGLWDLASIQSRYGTSIKTKI